MPEDEPLPVTVPVPEDEVALGIEARFAVNRLSWEERTAIHLASSFYDVEGWLSAGAGPDQREAALVGDVSGLGLLHLQCHFGLDTLAWARAGANVLGLDFSPAAIAAARDIATRAGLGSVSEFVCANVYDASDVLAGRQFDIVYVSLGSLCWLPSARRWAEQVGALLAPGGRLFFHDVHPLSMALAEDGETFAYSYFEETAPIVDEADQSYTGPSPPLKHRRSYQWNHSLAEVVNSLATVGVALESLEEHDWTVWPQFPWLQHGQDSWAVPAGRPRVPLSFTLLGQRL